VSNQLPIRIPYPWQQKAWQRVQLQIAGGKVPHALLIAGQKGIGKWNFAESLSDYLLCTSPRAGLACGKCRSCQLTLANTHPDKQVFLPEGNGKSIKIDQIRLLSAFITKTAQQGGRKVVILGPVEQLNVNAANALLKSLEEPAGDTVLMLMSHVSSAVMATIRSRCQLLPLSAPATAEAVSWLDDLQITNSSTLLRLAGGAPLIVKDMIEGDYLEHLQVFINTLDRLSNESGSMPNIQAAKEWLPIDLSHLTEWWLQIIHGILSGKYLPDINSVSVHEQAASDVANAMMRVLNVGQQYNPQWLFKFSDKLVLLRQQYLQGANPNMQLLIEELLLDWQAIIKRS